MDIDLPPCTTVALQPTITTEPLRPSTLDISLNSTLLSSVTTTHSAPDTSLNLKRWSSDPNVNQPLLPNTKAPESLEINVLASGDHASDSSSLLSPSAKPPMSLTLHSRFSPSLSFGGSIFSSANTAAVTPTPLSPVSSLKSGIGGLSSSFSSSQRLRRYSSCSASFGTINYMDLSHPIHISITELSREKSSGPRTPSRLDQIRLEECGSPASLEAEHERLTQSSIRFASACDEITLSTPMIGSSGMSGAQSDHVLAKRYSLTEQLHVNTGSSSPISRASFSPRSCMTPSPVPSPASVASPSPTRRTSLTRRSHSPSVALRPSALGAKRKFDGDLLDRLSPVKRPTLGSFFRSFPSESCRSPFGSSLGSAGSGNGETSSTCSSSGVDSPTGSISLDQPQIPAPSTSSSSSLTSSSSSIQPSVSCLASSLQSSSDSALLRVRATGHHLSNLSFKPSNLSLQPSNLSLQPSNLSLQPSNFSSQSSNLSPQPSNLSLQSSNLSLQPSISSSFNFKPSSDSSDLVSGRPNTPDNFSFLKKSLCETIDFPRRQAAGDCSLPQQSSENIILEPQADQVTDILGLLPIPVVTSSATFVSDFSSLSASSPSSASNPPQISPNSSVVPVSLAQKMSAPVLLSNVESKESTTEKD